MNPHILRIPLLVLISIAGYAVWYRLQVGPFCPAMWYGTAPPLIMIFIFYILEKPSRVLWGKLFGEE